MKRLRRQGGGGKKRGGVDKRHGSTKVHDTQRTQSKKKKKKEGIPPPLPPSDTRRDETTYLTWIISRPSLTSCGRSLTSFRFCAGSSTVLTPARRAPINFSLMPPTAVTRPRREISPCYTRATVSARLASVHSERSETHVRGNWPPPRPSAGGGVVEGEGRGKRRKGG